MGTVCVLFRAKQWVFAKFVNGTSDVLDQISSKYVIWTNIVESHENSTSTSFMGKMQQIEIGEVEEFFCVDSSSSIKFENRLIPVFARLKKNRQSRVTHFLRVSILICSLLLSDDIAPSDRT